MLCFEPASDKTIWVVLPVILESPIAHVSIPEIGTSHVLVVEDEGILQHLVHRW